MAEKTILTYPDAQLKLESQEIVDFGDNLQKIIEDMEDTMQQGPGAVGLAAPQIGYQFRVIIVDVSAKKKIKQHGHLVLINPEITHWEGMAKGREGCLSVPDYTGNVIRAKNIKLAAMSQDGEKLSFEMEGYEARAIQHELDHLDGILFLDRLVSRRNDLFRRKENNQ